MSKWGVSDVRWSGGKTYVKFDVSYGDDIIIEDFEVAEGRLYSPMFSGIALNKRSACCIYRQLVVEAPDGMVLLPQDQAIVPLLRRDV